MKVAIISDIHDNLANLEKCLTWCARAGIEVLLCCGDVTNQETLAEISQRFAGPTYLVKGNIDNWPDEVVSTLTNIKYLGRSGGAVELGGKKIALCHEPFLIDALIKSEQPDLVFYGHTHKPWEEKQENVPVINPGTLGGVFTKATFATYDTADDNLELKILEQL